jgi:hypothetical protein
MKILEILAEASVVKDIRRKEHHDGDGKDYGSTKEKLNPEQDAVMKGAIGIPGMENPYNLYRLGVAIASSERHPASIDHLGQEPLILPFTDGEHTHIKHHIKKSGYKSKKLSSSKSSEPSSVNTTSPTAKPKRNKYGI